MGAGVLEGFAPEKVVKELFFTFIHLFISNSELFQDKVHDCLFFIAATVATLTSN